MRDARTSSRSGGRDAAAVAGAAEYWDGVAAGWSRTQPQRLWRRHADAVNAQLVARWLSPGPVRRLLKTDLFDEAFGKGLYPLLAARAREVVGVDASPAILAEAARRYPDIEAHVADVRDLPFDDDSFEAVVSNSTLDHFASRDQLAAGLAELARVLRPGGRLVLTLDNPANPAVWLRNALPLVWLMRIGLVPYRVGRTCGRRRLMHLMSRFGLQARRTTAILHCPRAPAVALAGRLDRHRGNGAAGRRLLRWLGGFERLQGWPTRFWTGHFIAVLAVKTTRPCQGGSVA